MSSLIRMVAALQARLGVTTDGWVPGAPLWIAAVDYDSGQRTVFGRDGAPPATVGDAVLASCSIPGWFAPQAIGGRRYVDGGVRSSTSVGLLAEDGAPRLDEVYVLAPMASHAYDRPRDPLCAAERTSVASSPGGWTPRWPRSGRPASPSRCSPPGPPTWPPWAATS
jgi:NTE family protein